MSESSRSFGDAFERLALMSLEFFAAEFGLGEFAGSKVKLQGEHGDTWEVDQHTRAVNGRPPFCLAQFLLLKPGRFFEPDLAFFHRGEFHLLLRRLETGFLG